MLSLSLSQSHLRQNRTYLTFEQFLTRTRTWNLKDLRCMRRERGRNCWSVSCCVLASFRFNDGSKRQRWWLRNRSWTVAVVIMWKKCTYRGRKTPKAFIGWVSIAFISCVLHVLTHRNWDNEMYWSVHGICTKARIFRNDFAPSVA